MEREKADFSVQVIQLSERIEEVEAGADGQVCDGSDKVEFDCDVYFIFKRNFTYMKSVYFVQFHKG